MTSCSRRPSTNYFLAVATTSTLYALPHDCWSTVLVNSLQKYLHFHSGVTPWMVSPEAVPRLLLMTPLILIKHMQKLLVKALKLRHYQ